MGLEKATVEGLAISAGLGLAMSLRKPRIANGGLLESSDPPVLVARGDTIPLCIGMEVLPGMLVWEGANRIVIEDFQGGAGGKGIGAAAGGRNEVIYSQGQQVICVGPGSRLTHIEQDGRKIWPLRDQHPDGITPLTAPSGTSFTCRNAEGGGSEGTFRIYWGEIDQPVDALFADGSAKGHAANDGFVMSVVWDDKRTGGSRRWPVLKYGVAVMPYSSQMLYNAGASWDPDLIAPELAGSASWTKGYTIGDINKEHLIRNVVNSTTTKISLCGDVTSDFVAGDLCELRGTVADGAYEIVSSTLVAGGLINTLGNDVREVTIPLSTNAPTVTVSGPMDTTPSLPLAPFPNLPGGVVVDNLSVMGNYLDRAASFSVAVVNMHPDATGATVPRGAGAANRLGDGVHQIQLYFLKDLGGGWGFSFDIGFQTASGTAVASFNQSAAGVVTLASAGTGVTVIIESITGYNKITVRYLTGSDPSLDVGDEYSVRIAMTGTLSPLGGGAYRIGFVAKLDDPFLGFTLYDDCTVNHTDVELLDVPVAINEYEGSALPQTAVDEKVAGANAAHILNQVLTTPRPHGVGDLSSRFDIASLQALGTLLATEELRSHYVLNSGNKHSDVLSRMLFEIGVNVQWDATTGLWRFEALRTDTPDFTLPGQMILDDDVDEFSQSGSASPGVLMYRYRDSERNFSEEPVTVREDGIPENVLAAVRQKATLDSARDIQTASDIARRLYLIESTKPTMRSVHFDRDAATMRVGDILDTDGYLADRPLLVKAVGAKPGSRKVSVSLVSTPFVDVASQTNLLVSAPPPIGGLEVERDVAQETFELSAYMGEEVQYLGLRVSGSDDTSRAAAYFSRDGVSYQYAGSIPPVTGGVVLDRDYTSTSAGYDYWGQEKTSPAIISVGPTIRTLDPKFSSRIRNLSDAEFQAGEQWLIVGKEVMFVQRFVAVSAGIWQAQNVIRGRFEHGIESNISGRQAFVVHRDSLPILAISGTVGEPEAVKIVETKRDSATPLADAVAIDLATVGYGVRPPLLSGFKCVPATWHPSTSLSLTWDYANSDSMRLSKAAGLPGPAPGLHQGKFTLTIKDLTTGTLLATLEGDRRGDHTLSGADIESFLSDAGLSLTSTITINLESVGNSGLASIPKGSTLVSVPYAVV